MEATQHGLRRELKLRDLVLMQLILIVSLTWTGFAAKQGSSQIVLWLLAIVFFYLPLAAVVMKLSRAMPVEGGVYQWVKQGLSPFAGYMAGWSLTVAAICFFASIGSMLANGLAYAGGAHDSWVAVSKPFALTLTALACLIAFAMNVRGLHAAKWLSGTGSLLMIAAFLMLLYLLVRAWITGAPSTRGSLSLAWPGFSILTLNVFTKMALGALSGFDNSAIFSEECRKPENDVARSVFIAAPLIAFIYILGTLAVLAYVPPASVDLAAPVPQALRAGFGVTALGKALTLIAVYGVNVYVAASMVIIVGMVARLPMVAGWDGLLPTWWSQLHPRFRTPYKAIAAVTATLMLLGALSLLGAANQEAVQLSSAIAIGSLCIMYMLLFAVILFGFRRQPERPRIAIRLGALAAFTVAFVSLIFEILPLGEVGSTALFALKVGGTICAVNGFGAFLYWRGTRRLRRMAEISGC
jgi:glutamate:GABA antiporter